MPYIDEKILTAEEEPEKISGVVEHITYRSEESGYTVLAISQDAKDGGAEVVTLVGIMPMVQVGETLTCTGKWTFHKNFGRQFSVEYFEKQLPTSVSAILQYLSSRTVKGIGPKTAVKIVREFGEGTFEVIEKDPERLAQIPGISLSKAKEISDSFKEQFGVRAVMMFCRDYFGPATAVKIYKRWGGAAVDMMKQNPYMLCEEISGIGFEKADKVAKSLGLEDNSPERVRSGVEYVLRYNANANGHTLVPYERLAELTSQLLQVEKDLCYDAIDVLEYKKKVTIESIGGRKCVYLKRFSDSEHYIKDKLDMLEATAEKIKAGRAEELVGEIEDDLGIEYDKMQKKAILHSLEGGVLVLTGGPGTGKTTVIKGIIHLFSKLRKKFILAAPTGRAAKRMTETSGVEAKTIHRMLEMVYSEEREPKFMRDSQNPLDEELIIIDEASMIDTLLMASLLRAVRPGSRLVLIGDADQLPPVGAGNVLSEILRSQRYRTVVLKKIFRQAGESLIVTNAHAINSGENPELFCKNNDFFFIERGDENAIAETVTQLCVSRLPKKYGEELFGQIQVITPSHKGAAGTEALNIMLQRSLNPPSAKKREKKFRDKVFREGDRVMQIKNDYDIVWKKDGEEGLGIFNGDIGIIISVLSDDECMFIDFEGRMTRYDFTMLDELEHAYAITVHKSQGSEYPYVIIPVYNCGDRLLTRNLLYTAVTRAQTMVILVGSAPLIQAMVANNRQVKRYTGLKYILADEDNEYQMLKEKNEAENGEETE